MELTHSTCPMCAGSGWHEDPSDPRKTAWCDPCAGHGTVVTDWDPDYQMEMMQ